MQKSGILQPSILSQRPIQLRPLVSLLHWQPQSYPQSKQNNTGHRISTMAGACGTERSKQLLSVAPMMDWTDIHYRQLARLISRHTWLYTEMVVDMTILHSPHTDKHLYFPPEQHPIVCQLGGSNPEKLAAAAKVVSRYGYDEINLNCGCPSDRVAGAGCFGASLMLQPEAVGDACAAMQEATGTDVTVKCRLGVDNVDSYEELCHFIRTVSERSGVRHFIMHARKCLLAGLSPAQNRTIPPLRREWVWALKRDFLGLEFSLNGVVQDCHEAAAALEHEEAGVRIAGVMIGRAAYHGPWACLGNADRAVFSAPSNAAANRREVLGRYGEYGDAILGRFGVKDDGHKIPNVRAVVKPLIGLFYGEAGGKRWRNALDQMLLKKPATVSEVIQEAMKVLPEQVLDALPPQLEALPEFSLPQPMPPPLNSLASLGNGTSSAAAGPSSRDAAFSSGVHIGGNERQHAELAGDAEDIADVRVPCGAVQYAVGCAAAGSASAEAEEEASAEAKRLRINSAAALRAAPTAAAGEQGGDLLQHSQIQQPEGHAMTSDQAGEAGAGAEFCSDQQPHLKQTDGQSALLLRSRILISS